LGQTSKYSDGCEVIRLARDDDLRTLAGLQKALRIISHCPKGRTLLWSAMPCADGSPCQTDVNIALGVGLGRIEAHWRDFGILWDNFVIVAKVVIDIEGVVALEWPGRCKCWLDPRVDDVLMASIWPKGFPWLRARACCPMQCAATRTHEEALEMLQPKDACVPQQDMRGRPHSCRMWRWRL
jgi:hypothetical protein